MDGILAVQIEARYEYPLVSLNKALVNLYFWGGGIRLGGGRLISHDICISEWWYESHVCVFVSPKWLALGTNISPPSRYFWRWWFFWLSRLVGYVGYVSSMEGIHHPCPKLMKLQIPTQVHREIFEFWWLLDYGRKYVEVQHVHNLYFHSSPWISWSRPPTYPSHSSDKEQPKILDKSYSFTHLNQDHHNQGPKGILPYKSP